MLRAAFAFLRSLFLVSVWDYLAGFIGGLSITSLLAFAFNLDFGPSIESLLSIYDTFMRAWADPLGQFLQRVFDQLIPHWNIDLSLNETWRHGIVLIALYVQRHARNELSNKHPVTFTFQIASGIVIAIAAGAIGSTATMVPGMWRDLADLALFSGAVAVYDIAFILWACAFLRLGFATPDRPALPPRKYIVTNGSRALSHDAIIALICAGVYLAALALGASNAIGFAIALVIFLVGVRWCWTGLERVVREQADKTWFERMKVYLSRPAGKLGNAVLFAFLVSGVITALGLSETRLGTLIEVIAG